MKLTIIELFLLCQIAGINRLNHQKGFRIYTKNEKDDAFKSLEKKGFIADKSLTDRSISLLSFLVLYNDATHYIRIGNGVFAEIAEHEYLLITNEDDELVISPISQDEILIFTLDNFKNIENVNDENPYQRMRLRKQKFNDFLEEERMEEMLFYTRYIESKTDFEFAGAYYVFDGMFNHYLIDEERLEKYPLQRVQEGMERIFSKEVDLDVTT